MKTKFMACLLISQLFLLPRLGMSQTAETINDANFVTFTFNSACEDCATQNNAGVYIVDVPSVSTPALAKSPSLKDLNLQVTLKNDRVVYSFSFKPGTSPRAVWRKGATVLQVFFAPATDNLATAISDVAPKPVA